MTTIIKAILKFFKLSKLSFIGLFVLIFFSLSIFTVMNSTNINLTQSYQKISTQGNLHDFVINENYKYGNGPYILNTSESGSSNGDVDIKAISNSNNDKKTYSVTFELNLSLIEKGGSYEWTQAYEEYCNDSKFDSYKTFISTITLDSEQDVNINNWKSNSDFKSKASSIVSNKSSNLESDVQEFWEDKFINEVEGVGTSIRNFNSINISNSKQNIFFKLINYSPDFTIDKLVIYDGNTLTSNTDFSDVDKVINSSSTELSNNASLTRNIIKYFYKAQWTDTTNKFTSLYNYVENHPNYNPYTNNDGSTTVSDDQVSKQSKLLKTIIDENGITNNGYQVKFSYSEQGLAPVSGKFEDFSSYGAIISPDYMQRLGKKPVNYDDWINHITKDSQAEFDVWLNSLSQNTFKVDNQTFVILGTGVSPDFMYPVVSFENVVPNSKTEQIVYTNSSGYSKMVNSFRGNEQENFLVGKFNNDKTKSNNEKLTEINNISKKYMSWPSNINAAYMYNDTSNSMSPTALRVVFIPKIVSTISAISAYLTTFILLLSIFISLVIIKRSIESNRNSLGIMQANGYRKREIIIGVCFLIFIPTFIGTILGYIFGLSLQNAAISILGGFWTIPTTMSGLSLSVFVPIVFLLSLMFVGITILFSWLSLRGETSEFMKDDSKYKMSKITSLMKKPFVKFDILTRLRSAIAFSSFWRLLLLSVMAAILTSALTFSVNVLHSFSDSASLTYSPRNFTYSLNLVTPTLQSGQYYAVPYQQQGKTLNKKIYFDTSLASDSVDYSKSDDYISQNYWQSSAAYSKYATNSSSNSSSYNSTFAKYVQMFGNYQLISQDDLNAQKTDLFYLKNKTTTKPFADVTLGLGSITSNPWTLAAQLTPSNYSTYASQAFKNMFESSVSNNKNQIDIGYRNTNNGKSTIETDTLFNYIKSFSKAYAVLKDEASSSISQPSISDFGQMKYFDSSSNSWKKASASTAKVVTQSEIDNNSSVFYDSIDSNNDSNYNYYLEFDNSKIGGNNYQPNSSTPVTDINIYFLNLLYYLYSLDSNSQYTYSINYGKIVVDQNDTPYSYMDFNIESINDSTKNFTDDLNAIGLSKNNDYTLINDSKESLIDKLWNTEEDSIIRKNQSGKEETYDVFPVVINKYTQKKYSLKPGDIIKVKVTNSADRYSRKYAGVNDPIAYLKVIDVATTYQGSEFFMSQYDVNRILGLSINNIQPKLPLCSSEIKDYVDWSNTTYDYGNNYLSSSNPTESDSKNSSDLKKENFDISRSGFNGIFSRAKNSLPEVTNGLSLYSVSGIYPGTDVISENDSVMTALFSNEQNITKALNTLGFYGTSSITSKDLIKKIAEIFGTSSTFSIVSAASSKTASLDVLNITSVTLTKIQDTVLGIIAIITVLIIVVMSSLIINDSLKLAAILKCLGLNDRKNATSFLSVYIPVFVIGLLLSIPLTFMITSIYVEFVFGFAGILIVVNSAWWHFIAATVGIVFIFFLSYWSTWMKIKKMNLSKSIK